MIVLGVIGRPDRPKCHDAAACLVVDGRVVGALEQERVSRRRHSKGEGAEGAVLALLAANDVHPSEVDGIGFAWADAPDDAEAVTTDLPCGALFQRQAHVRPPADDQSRTPRPRDLLLRSSPVPRCAGLCDEPVRQGRRIGR